MPGQDMGGGTSPALLAALDYAQRGVGVFPAGRDKQPLTQHGFKDASTDEATIIAWWQEHPGANVALDIPADLVIVDVDPRNGGELPADLPATRTVRTPSGGVHAYYRLPPGVELRGKLAMGVDLKRGGKGYVLAPPSVTDQGTYEWVDEAAPIADLPADYIDRAKKQARPERQAPASAPALMPWETGTPYGLAAKERELGRLAMAAEGERNETLNRAAFALGQLIGGGELREDETVDRLLEVADRIGLEPDEAAATVTSGLRAGLNDPRNAPVRDEPWDQDTGDAPFWLDWEVDEAPAEWLLYPIIPRESYVLVYGSTESSKSIVMQWLGAHLSREGQSVSMYSLENPAKVDRDRMRRLKPDPRFFRISQQPLDLNVEDQVRGLIERDTGRDLIIIDTYSHAFNTRTDDENNKAIEFSRVVRRIIKQTGAAVAVIDHTGYENRWEPRGASAKRQAVDVAIFMESRGRWVKGKPAQFGMMNRKSSRFANPFELTGAVIDTDDGGLGVAFNERWVFAQEDTA